MRSISSRYYHHTHTVAKSHSDTSMSSALHQASPSPRRLKSTLFRGAAAISVRSRFIDGVLEYNFRVRECHTKPGLQGDQPFH